jgi:hypothetical protein
MGGVMERDLDKEIIILEEEILDLDFKIVHLEDRIVLQREELRILEQRMVRLKAMRLAQKFDKPGAES